MKLTQLIARLFGRKAELVNTTTPSIDPVEDCPSELFDSLLVATHVARNFGVNAKFMTFSESGLDVPQGFHVYDWSTQGVLGLSVRNVQDDGGVIYVAATDEEWLLGFVRGFRAACGAAPVVHTDDDGFVRRIAQR